MQRRESSIMKNRPGLSVVALTVALVAGLFGLACQPSIGDRCNISTDCSQRGDRLCDKSVDSVLQADGKFLTSNGYCTIFNCVGNGCPDEAACVVFGGNVPGCGYVDRGISRSARSFCLKTCETDNDCRKEEGYVCKRVVRPGKAPTNVTRNTTIEALVLDDVQERSVCVLVNALAPVATLADPDAAVCRAEAPAVDAGASGLDASRDGAGDARPSDAAPEGSAPDAGSSDAGSSDASDGGG